MGKSETNTLVVVVILGGTGVICALLGAPVTFGDFATAFGAAMLAGIYAELVAWRKDAQRCDDEKRGP